MPFTVDDYYDIVRAETANDEDTQFTDAQLDLWGTVEYKKLHKRLSNRFPELFTATSDEVVLTTGQQEISKPNNLAKLLHVEREESGVWTALPKATKVTPERDPYLGWREEGALVVITPAGSAPGTYRLKFVITPSSSWPAGDIPSGFEDIIFQKVIAKCKIRMESDPTPHWQEADRTWNEQVKAQRSRQGTDPEPGFVTGYGAGSDGWEDV